MVQASRVIGRLVRPSGHVVIFRSADQIAARKAVLCTPREPGQTTHLFAVYGAPLVVTRHPLYQKGYASRSTTALNNFAEFEVHTNTNGAGQTGLGSVSYRNHVLVQLLLQEAHNALEIVRKASPAEMAYAVSGYKRQQMLRRSKIHVALL